MGWLALLGPPTSRVLESDMSWEHFVTRVIFVPELPVMLSLIHICLCLVFAVVIFFWMAFHQNGNTLTLFARDFTQTSAEGVQSMLFEDVYKRQAESGCACESP